MKKSELYRSAVKAKMDSGVLCKHTAIGLVAHGAGVSPSTVDRAMRKTSKKKSGKSSRVGGKRIIVIPDTQCKPNNPTEHIRAAARYIVKKKPDIVVILGDWWDMESLSVFNTRKQAEGLRVKDDIDCGMNAMDEFMEIIRAGISKRSMPRLVFTHGNHSMQVRLPRFIEQNPHLDGMITDETTPFLEQHGFEVYPFLEVVDIEGIYVAHYIQNPHSLKGSPLGGAMTTMLKNAGHSFIMGHQQVYKYDKQFLSNGDVRIGVVAGAFYQHEEGYMSVQGNRHWRGIFMLNEVANGSGDMCEVSMKFLLNNYGDGVK